MVTKSIRLTEEEAARLKKYLDVTGEVEATALKRAALRGLQEMRVEQGILAYLRSHSSSEAAEIAGLPRAEFLQILIDKGITIIDGPSTFGSDLAELAKRLGNRKLLDVARVLEAEDE
jgi:predicted HTH domain antitoxin